MDALEQVLETFRGEIDSVCSQMARASRAQATNELNQSVRRLRHYQTEGEWISALQDGASHFVQSAAIFTLQDSVLALRSQVKLDLPQDLSFPVASANAFATAIQMKDRVVALRTAGEVTSALSVEGGRAHIVPVANGTRVVAILFAADSEDIDVSALELLAGVSSSVLERRSNDSIHTQLASPQPSVSSSPSARPSWADLSQAERDIHIRAQRFSRVAIAEMQAAKPEASRAGREQENLYVFLKNEIDKARVNYRKQFMTTPHMVDYLHLELVRIAAEGDESRLGADYPGQLV